VIYVPTRVNPHDKLKTRLKETIHKAFSHRNYGSKFVVLGYNSTYFPNKIQKGKTTPYAGEAGILLHIFGKFVILKLKSSRLS
jgi:hypothetical protein